MGVRSRSGYPKLILETLGKKVGRGEDKGMRNVPGFDLSTRERKQRHPLAQTVANEIIYRVCGGNLDKGFIQLVWPYREAGDGVTKKRLRAFGWGKVRQCCQ